MLLASLGTALLYIAIWTVIMIGSIVLVIKIRSPYKNRKPHKAYQEKLSKALAENWIRINIKDTKYNFVGITTTSETDGSFLSETSIYGGIDRQFSNHRTTKTEDYDCQISCKFKIEGIPVKSISHELHMNPTSVKMFCESGMFEILVNPQNYQEYIWREL